MRQVMIVNLDNRTYHLDEEALAALRHYLDRARTGLRNDPDLNEVLGDFERSIAEKCAGVVQSGKNVIGPEEMNRILEEMGPVAGGPEAAAEEPAANGSKGRAAAPRKLYKQPRGAKLSGVCTGLGEYFGIDPVFIRIAFILLSFFAGLGLLAYLILEVLMPWPSAYDQKRYKALKGTLFLLALFILYVWGNSMMAYPGRMGMFGLRPMELLFVPIMMGLYLIPFVAVILVVSLVAVASVKYIRSNSRGKE